MTYINCNFKKFYEEKENKNIIVFGAGVYSKELFRYSHLQDRVLFFVDNDTKKQNTTIDLNGFNFDIFPVSKLTEEKYNDSVILIGSPFYDTEMLNQLNEIGLEHYYYLIKDILDVSYNTIRYIILDIMEGDYSDKGKIQKNIEEIIGYKTDKIPLCVPRFNFSVTEKCTLKCKHCRALIPYMENPVNVPFEKLKDEIDALINNVDIIGSCEVIGGETFLYPHLAEAINYLSSFDKVKCIRITTNCTVFPDEKLVTALKNGKVMLQLSDYGLLEKMAALVRVLEKNNIPFRIEKYENWEDNGFGEFLNKTPDEIKKKFDVCKYRGRCSVTNAVFVEGGKIWACARASRSNRIGINITKDFREISANDTKEEIHAKIEDLFATEFIEACNYCGQGEKTIKKVKPAIQLKTGELNSSKYTIVNREEYNELLRKAKY